MEIASVLIRGFLEKPFVHDDASAGFAEVEASLDDQGVAVRRNTGVASGTGVTVQLDQRILYAAFFQMLVFGEQALCFLGDDFSLSLHFFLQRLDLAGCFDDDAFELFVLLFHLFAEIPELVGEYVIRHHFLGDFVITVFGDELAALLLHFEGFLLVLADILKPDLGLRDLLFLVFYLLGQRIVFLVVARERLLVLECLDLRPAVFDGFVERPARFFMLPGDPFAGFDPTRYEKYVLVERKDFLRKAFLKAQQVFNLIVEILEPDNKVDFCMVHYN